MDGVCALAANHLNPSCAAPPPQAAVFTREGAIGVGLVNAVRGACITVVIALLFCSPRKRHLCLTRQTLLSAAVTTLGGAIYVLAGGPRRPPAPQVAAVVAPPSPAAAAKRRAAGNAAAADAAAAAGDAAAAAGAAAATKDKDA